jgi:integrase
VGACKISDVTADDLQKLIDRLVGSGLSGQRVRNIITALQALYRRYRRQGPVDPTHDLDLPEPGASREWTRPASDVAELIAAAPEEDRAIWACAFYAGLRLGELRALQANQVGEHSIHVEYGWDPKEGRIDPKSKAGVREVPVPEILRGILDAHIARTGRCGDECCSVAHRPRRSRRRTFRTVQTRRGRPSSSSARVFIRADTSNKSALDHAGISESRADRHAGHCGRCSRFRAFRRSHWKPLSTSARGPTAARRPPVERVPRWDDCGEGCFAPDCGPVAGQ